jgi:hypothetical protein
VSGQLHAPAAGKEPLVLFHTCLRTATNNRTAKNLAFVAGRSTVDNDDKNSNYFIHQLILRRKWLICSHYKHSQTIAFKLGVPLNIRGYIQKFPDWVDNEINNKHSLRSNTKGYGTKTDYTGSQNSDTTAPSGTELYHLQFPLQATSPETFGYSLVNVLSAVYTHSISHVSKFVFILQGTVRNPTLFCLLQCWWIAENRVGVHED